jgi:imidazolonepropionase-like amidohydrolase
LIRKEDDLVGAMMRAGVGILAGTDDANPYVIPGFSLHDELALLVAAGLTTMQALQAATYNPAKFLGRLDSLGTIQAGKLADLLLLDADPLADIRNTTKINAVVSNGRLLDRQELDALLAGVEAKSATTRP